VRVHHRAPPSSVRRRWTGSIRTSSSVRIGSVTLPTSSADLVTPKPRYCVPWVSRQRDCSIEIRMSKCTQSLTPPDFLWATRCSVRCSCSTVVSSKSMARSSPLCVNHHRGQYFSSWHTLWALMRVVVGWVVLAGWRVPLCMFHLVRTLLMSGKVRCQTDDRPTVRGDSCTPRSITVGKGIDRMRSSTLPSPAAYPSSWARKTRKA
jgi:hypothetical protein